MIETVLWWAIPLGITIASVSGACFWPMDDDFAADIRRFVLFAGALFITALAWAIGAICK